LLKITSEGGVASGVRRIEAVTAAGAMGYFADQKTQLEEKLQEQQAKSRQLEKALEQMKTQLAAAKGSDLVGNAVDVNGVKVLAANLDGVEPKALRDTIDQLKNKLGSGVVVLATVADGKIALAAGVTKDVTSQIKAGDIIKDLTAKIGGKGGGRPDFAQGGGVDVDALPSALASVEALVEAATV
jgi:alanyl-tRNA synthetase